MAISSTKPDPLATQTIAASIAPTANPRTPSAISNPSHTSASSDGSRFAPGSLLANRYRIIAILGRGGMGEVYRADDLTLGQQVALKFLPPSVASNPNSVERFRNEVRVARRVSHPNVCRVYDLGEFDGNLFLSMEYVDGEDLGSLLRRIGRLPEDKALEIARKLCAGLAAAHEQGILHRDLKPSNVMLDARGQILLTDFGLAGLADQIGGAEVRNGTPAYMAPEQLEGKEVTIRSDIYSLGLVLYEIFTGKRPYESDTLAGLERARKSGAPPTPSTLVKDLDPRIERVILRCLESDPARRPPTALAVAGALPGGDPLAAALAAGETPSPEMVAAAGEHSCITASIALPIFLATLLVLAIQAVLQFHLNAIDKTGLDTPTEVLEQKAHDLLSSLGYSNPPVDVITGFDINGGLLGAIQQTGHPPDWDRRLRERPPALIFQYRQSDAPLVSDEYHDDKLTPGIVTMENPPLTTSGMINLETDIHGRLLDFEAIPSQVLEPLKQPAPPPDWNALFKAADLDPTQFHSVEPTRAWLAASDIRAAWEGKWPGVDRPLHIEAAALRGKPVAFAVLSSWNHPDRLPDNSASSSRDWIETGLFFALVIFAPWLALHNFSANRGDVRGAFRLAAFIFSVQMILWLFRGHFAPTLGELFPFILGLCSSAFYGAMMWFIYMAVEPYIRRRWPQAIIGWSNVLAGNWRDPIVGRDALIGAATAALWLLFSRLSDTWQFAHGVSPNFGDTVFLEGLRHGLGRAVLSIPDAIRTALVLLFLIFLFRVVLRNQWLAIAAVVAIFVVLATFGSPFPWSSGIEIAASYGLAAIVVTRFGLLAAATGVFVHDLLINLPVTTNTSAPYFPVSMLMMALALAFCIWAFRTSVAGTQIWRGANLLDTA